MRHGIYFKSCCNFTKVNFNLQAALSRRYLPFCCKQLHHQHNLSPIFVLFLHSCRLPALLVICIVCKILWKPVDLGRKLRAGNQVCRLPLYVLRVAHSWSIPIKHSMNKIYLSLQSQKRFCGYYTVALCQLRWMELNGPTKFFCQQSRLYLCRFTVGSYSILFYYVISLGWK